MCRSETLWLADLVVSCRFAPIEVADGDPDLCEVEESGGSVGDENLDRADPAAGRDQVDVVGRSPVN